MTYYKQQHNILYSSYLFWQMLLVTLHLVSMAKWQMSLTSNQVELL